MRPIKSTRFVTIGMRVIWIFAAIFAGVLPAYAQQTHELQKQLQHLKEQYEQTTRELQERIVALEEQVKK